MKKQRIVIIGGGGHAKVVIDAIKCSKKFKIYGIVDQRLPKDTDVLGVKVIGNDEILPAIFGKGIKNAFIAVGSVGDKETINRRVAIFKRLDKLKFDLPAVVHPKAIVAKGVKLGDGTFVAAGATINPAAKIGKNTIINTGASIDHDCMIGDFVHIAPNAALSGGVIVEDEAHIGTNASISHGVKVGRGSLVKVGDYLTRDLPENSVKNRDIISKRQSDDDTE